MASVSTMAYTVKVQGKISVLSSSPPPPPTGTALNPETLLDGPFSTFAEFEKNLHDYEKATFAVFRKNNTTSVQTARRYLKHTMPDDIVYHRAQFVCTHYGPPRYRGKGIINNTTTLATGCEAEIVLLWNNSLQKLVVTRKNLDHNHDVNAFTYAQQYKVKRLTVEQREELKEHIKENMQGVELRNIINQKYNKCFSLRDTRVLKHQLKKEMGLATPKASKKAELAVSEDMTLDAELTDARDKVSQEDLDSEARPTDAKKRRRSRRSNAQLDELAILSDPDKISDMSQFVRYLDASYRRKVRRRNDGDEPNVDPTRDNFSIRRPNPKRQSTVDGEMVDISQPTYTVVVGGEQMKTECIDEAVEVVEGGKSGPGCDPTSVTVVFNGSSAVVESMIANAVTIGDPHTGGGCRDNDLVKECRADGAACETSGQSQDPGDQEMSGSRNFHFFMDLCRQLDSLSPKRALAARRELGEVLHKHMMADIEERYGPV